MRPEHRWTWGNLSAYVDGELSPSDAARAERHLKECRDCQRELDSLCQLTDLLRQVPTRPVPRPFFITEEKATERRRLRTRSWVYGTLRTASVLATLLLVLVIGGDLLFFGSMGLLPGLGKPAMAPPREEVMVVERVLETQVVEAEEVLPAQTPREEVMVAEKVLETQVVEAEEALPTQTPPAELVPRKQDTEPTGRGAPAVAPSPMALAPAPGQAEPDSGAEKSVVSTAPEAEQPVAAAPPSSEAATTFAAQPTEGALAHAQPAEAPTELTTPLREEHPAPTDLPLRRLRNAELVLSGVVVVLIAVTLLLRRTIRRY